MEPHPAGYLISLKPNIVLIDILGELIYIKYQICFLPFDLYKKEFILWLLKNRCH